MLAKKIFFDQHHPARSNKEASQHFLMSRAAPPRLRRGIFYRPHLEAALPVKRAKLLEIAEVHTPLIAYTFFPECAAQGSSGSPFGWDTLFPTQSQPVSFFSSSLRPQPF